MINIDYSRDELFDELGLTRLRDSYMLPTETSPQDRLAFVSEKFSSNKEHAQRLYDYASNHWLSYSTPILSFGRSKRGLPISCYLTYLDDTSEGLINTLSETNWLSMHGGGVGIHVGIRGSDEKSVGVMPHLKVYDAASLAYKQGSSRRGSYAAYLDIDHPDIVRFIEMRKATGDPNIRASNLNHGINITDKFMQLIEKCMTIPGTDDSWDLIQPNTGQVVETVSAKWLWALILETRLNTGEPYLWFIDTANKELPEYQKTLGLRINGSNLCVAPETNILTDEGYKVISSLENKLVNVWNGKQFSETTVIKTGQDQKVITVKLDNGISIDCTTYHKFFVKNNYHKNEEIVQASDLKPGDKLIRAEYPVIEGIESLLLDYQNGFFSGDGCFYKDDNIVYLYGKKRSLIDLFKPYASRHNIQESQDREVLIIPKLKHKFFVPDTNYTIDSRLKWLAGYMDADGVVLRNNNSQTIQVSSINLDFLKDVQKVLHTLGCYSTIKLMHAAALRKLPKNDGSGELGDYNCKDCYRLLISSKAICTLLKLGLSCNRLVLTDHIPDRDATRLVKVVSIIDNGRVCDTYCFNEPEEHKGVFNGVLTGNCSEVSLATSTERTAVCCLSSVNAEYYDTWKDNTQFLPDVLEMLDNALEYFIQNAPDNINRAKYSAYRERSVGVGMLGFHSYLQKNNIPFESAMAKSINMKMFRHIRISLDTHNIALAIERGSCPDANDAGITKRFSHVMAIAPNASSSIIVGNTSPSIEPFAANIYRQDTISGVYIVKNKYLDAILLAKAKNMPDECWYDDTIASITANNGSVKHLDWMDDYTKSVFATALEIDQRWVVEHASDRQRFIDQAQSLNLFFHPTVNTKYIHDIHFNAWQFGLKSLYYCRSRKIMDADKIGKSIERIRIEDESYSDKSCMACEG